MEKRIGGATADSTPSADRVRGRRIDRVETLLGNAPTMHTFASILGYAPHSHAGSSAAQLPKFGKVWALVALPPSPLVSSLLACAAIRGSSSVLTSYIPQGDICPGFHVSLNRDPAPVVQSPGSHNRECMRRPQTSALSDCHGFRNPATCQMPSKAASIGRNRSCAPPYAPICQPLGNVRSAARIWHVGVSRLPASAVPEECRAPR